MPRRERAEWVKRFMGSGLTQAEFARQHGLGYPALRKWIGQYRRREASELGTSGLWQEVKVPVVSGTARWVAEVVRPDGWVVRVAQDASPTFLEMLLRVGAC